jgi:hypothetical protein
MKKEEPREYHYVFSLCQNNPRPNDGPVRHNDGFDVGQFIIEVNAGLGRPELSRTVMIYTHAGRVNPELLRRFRIYRETIHNFTATTKPCLLDTVHGLTLMDEAILLECSNNPPSQLSVSKVEARLAAIAPFIFRKGFKLGYLVCSECESNRKKLLSHEWVLSLLEIEESRILSKKDELQEQFWLFSIERHLQSYIDPRTAPQEGGNMI